MTEEEQDPKQLNPGLIEHRAGNRALFNMARKYFAVICGALFALILASPTLPNIEWVSTGAVLGGYLIVGLLGLFQHELWQALVEVTGREIDIPEFFKRVFVVYVMVGFLLLVWLLTWCISQKVPA